MKNYDLKILTVEEVEAETVKWLWKPYIALGKITLVSDDAGIGKSTMLLAIAANLTRGAFFGAPDINEPCDVICQTAEDSYADTVKPSLQHIRQPYWYNDHLRSSVNKDSYGLIRFTTADSTMEYTTVEALAPRGVFAKRKFLRSTANGRMARSQRLLPPR